MRAVIALLYRLGHFLGSDIVIDGGGGYELLLLQLGRQIVEILLEQ